MQSNKIKLELVWETCLEECNKIRKAHYLPKVQDDLKIHKDAQAHASYLAQENKFETTTMGNKYATNIVTSHQVSVHAAIKDAIETLNTSKKYPFYLKKNCNKIGIGVARNEKEKKWVVVMFFEMSQQKPVAKQR